MYRKTASLVFILLAAFACLTVSASAAGYKPAIDTAEHIGGIVYYHNGTIAYGDSNGTLTLCNPAPSSPLSSINLTLPDGSMIFLDTLAPSADHTENYTINRSDVTIPLKLNETIVPSSLYTGMQQQLRLCVEIENTGTGNITGFKYQKELPRGLSVVWNAYDGGSLDVDDNVTWTIGDIRPGQKMNLSIAFDVTPTGNIYFPAAYIWLTYHCSLAGDTVSFSGNTNTSFVVDKANPAKGMWFVSARVPDRSDFTIDLNNISLYRSNVEDPFNTSLIASYLPNIELRPGCEWNISLTDYYDHTPAYFLRISYSIPYDLDQVTYLESPAMTEPINITVSSPPVNPTEETYYKYASPLPTIRPPPPVYPDILFVEPYFKSVVTNNTTDLLISVPPSDDGGYVVYYGSPNNLTWTKLGEVSVYGNMSSLNWSVPDMNGNYYLRAEHYTAYGLRGIAYTQILIVHEIQPVDLTTMILGSIDWLNPIAPFAVLIMLLLILFPLLWRKPVVYDSSALRKLSLQDKNWHHKLPKNTIRPEELLSGIEGMEKIKANGVKNKDEIQRLVKDFNVNIYDAMAIELAIETNATLYTDSARIAEICKKLDVKVRLMND